MTISIKYFASLREEIGRASDKLEVSTALSVLDAWRQATGRNDLVDNVLVAVNQEYSSVDAMVNDGDEIAFFPPVTGG